MLKFIQFEKKFGWPELIALGAIILSGLAIWQSHLARQDARILNKLDFRPTLALRAHLRKTGSIPAHINIKNTGPVDAIQVQVQFHFLRYFPDQNNIRAAMTMTGSDLQWTIERLPPLKSVDIKFNETLLSSYLPAINFEQHHRILEILLIYRREVDLKEYNESAFYFMSQEGLWVTENNTALDSELYKPIKEAVFSRFNIQSDLLDRLSDTLHSWEN